MSRARPREAKNRCFIEEIRPYKSVVYYVVGTRPVREVKDTPFDASEYTDNNRSDQGSIWRFVGFGIVVGNSRVRDSRNRGKMGFGILGFKSSRKIATVCRSIEEHMKRITEAIWSSEKND